MNASNKIQLLIQEGRYDEAQSEISRYLEQRNKDDYFRLLLLKARLLLQQGLQDECFELLEQLHEELEKGKSMLTRETYLEFIVDYANLMLNKSNKNEARKSFEKVISLLESSDRNDESIHPTTRHRLLGKAYLGLSQALMELGPSDRMETLLEKSLEHARKSKDVPMLITSLTALANWYLLRTKIPKVLECISEIRKIENNVHDGDRFFFDALGDSYATLSIFELYRGNITTSRETLVKGMQFKEKGRDLKGKIRLLYYFSILASINGNHVHSQLLHEAAIHLCQSTGIHQVMAGPNFEGIAAELMLESFPPQLEEQIINALDKEDILSHFRRHDILFTLHLTRILMRDAKFEKAAKYLVQARRVAWSNHTSMERHLVEFEWLKLFMIKNDYTLAATIIDGMKLREELSHLTNIRLLYHESLIVLQKIIHEHNCQLTHESIQIMTRMAHELSKELELLRTQGLYLIELEMTIVFILMSILSGNYPKKSILRAFDRFNTILKEKPSLKHYKKSVQATFTSLFLTIEPHLMQMSIEQLPNMATRRLNQIFRAFILPTSLHLLKHITNCITRKDNQLHHLLSQTFIVAFWFNTAIGPEILCSENTELFGNIQGVLQYMASTLILAIGQGSGYHEGTYGPLPFQLSNDPDFPKVFSCLVHSRQFPLQQANYQSKHSDFRYVLLTFVFPKELLLNGSSVTYTKIDQIFSQTLNEVKDISDINEDLLFILRHHLLTVFL